MFTPEIQDAFISILQAELVPAMGCTEPIAVAYCAAKMREALGCLPERMDIEVSGNMLKNAKSVIVPNTGNLYGIGAAAAAGVVAGDASAELQVIASVKEEQHAAIKEYAEKTPVTISCPINCDLLDIRITGYAGEDRAYCRIAGGHTNITALEKNGEVLYSRDLQVLSDEAEEEKKLLTIENVLSFARKVDISLVADLIERQIAYNSAIAEEGLRNNWGSNIGSTLITQYGSENIKTEARAWAAAGSDARMSGCDMPVVICSGSGNQGITASMPVYRYAKRLGASHEMLLRSVMVADLITIYQKAGIGKLSAYCGAISAGVGSAAGVAFLQGASDSVIAQTVVNGVAILSGTICDGAKSSCAAKIAMAVEAGLLGYSMALSGNSFRSGDGIVGTDVDATVADVGVLAREGMVETDRTILSIMTK